MRHPKEKELDRMAKGFSRFVKSKPIDYLLLEAAEGIVDDKDCDDVLSSSSDVESEELWEVHEEDWLPKFRKADRKFDALVEEYIDLYLSVYPLQQHKRKMDDAIEAIEEGMTEYFWSEVGFSGDDLEDYYDHMRDECKDAEGYHRDPYTYHGLSRRDFLASSKRVAARYASVLASRTRTS